MKKKAKKKRRFPPPPSPSPSPPLSPPSPPTPRLADRRSLAMICSTVITRKMLLYSIGATVFAILWLDVLPLVLGKKTIAEEKWTVQELSNMARSDTLVAAVYRLMNAAYKSGAPENQVGGIQEVIDAAAEDGIRTALLMVADIKGDRQEDPLDAFARSVSAAATCGTPGTAGGDGLDVCVAQCERKPSFLAKAPHDGACYMLCSLAVAPCTRGMFSWRTFSNALQNPGTIKVISLFLLLVSFAYGEYMIKVKYRAELALAHEAEKRLKVAREELKRLKQLQLR